VQCYYTPRVVYKNVYRCVFARTRVTSRLNFSVFDEMRNTGIRPTFFFYFHKHYDGAVRSPRTLRKPLRERCTTAFDVLHLRRFTGRVDRQITPPASDTVRQQLRTFHRLIGNAARRVELEIYSNCIYFNHSFDGSEDKRYETSNRYSYRACTRGLLLT